jgi:phospholipid/cholesterol/gamma-HCH transport system substrate-binding protein
MVNKARTTVIGAFIFSVLLALFGFVFWITRAGDNRNKAEYEVLFEGSVSGLLVGSGVSFNGLRVGSVKAMRLNPTDPRQVIALINVEDNTPVRTDTAVISMRGGISSAAKIPFDQGRLPLLYADNSAMQDMLTGARQIMGRADGIVERIDRVIADNQGSIRTTVQNTEKFSQALGDASPDISNLLRDVAEASRKISNLSSKLDILVSGLDVQKLNNTISNIEVFTSGLAAQTGNIQSFVLDAKSTANKMETAFGALSEALKGVDSVKLGATLNNVESFTGSLAKSAPQLETMMKEASEAAQKLNAMTARVDKLMSSFDSNGTGSMFTDFSEAAKAIKLVSERLDKRFSEISNSIMGFSNKGMRDVESFVSDGKRTLGQLERSLKSLESNPQRLIFGGSNVPEYNRR